MLSLIVLVVVIVGVAIAWLTVGRNEVPRTAPTKVSVFTRAARADLYGDAINEEPVHAAGRPVRHRPGRPSTTAASTGSSTAPAPRSAGCPTTFRRVQTGFVRSYALSVLAGAVLVVLALLAVNLA